MSIFTNAKTVAAAAPAKGKKAKKAIIACPRLEALAALEAVAKNIEAAIIVEKTAVNSVAFDHFVSEGMGLKRRPENCTGTDNGSEGSLQLRARSSRSVLSIEEREMFDDNEISYVENIDKEETFIINPEYANNSEMLEAVAAALASVNLPADFILKQEKVSTFIATEESIDEVFKIEDEATVRALLPLVAVQASRLTLAKDTDPFEIVERIMTPATPKAAEAK